jgi:hypothetical protein
VSTSQVKIGGWSKGPDQMKIREISGGDGHYCRLGSDAALQVVIT